MCHADGFGLVLFARIGVFQVVMYKGCSITNYGMVSSCYFYNMKNPKCTFCKEFDRGTFFDNFTNIMSEFCKHLIWRHCHWLRLMTCLTVLVLGVFSTTERASFKNFETWGHRAHCTIFRSMKIVKYQYMWKWHVPFVSNDCVHCCKYGISCCNNVDTLPSGCSQMMWQCRHMKFYEI